MTSPPYWGLRDYGTATWEGGEAGCDHIERTAADSERSSTLGGKFTTKYKTNSAFEALERQYRDICRKCNARRIDAQLGLEPTPDLYVEHMVQVFRDVRRVLRDDGTLWLNLGDSYAGVGAQTGGTNSKERGRREERMFKPGIMWADVNLKQKDLCGIPWRVAFALQADGWYLRSDIIWAKPNPMPESVTDRPTKAHEYLFLLTKRERYYYDAEAIAEAATPGSHVTTPKSFGGQAAANGTRPTGNQIPGTEWSWGARRNRRSVWTIATEPYPEAHFATFPTDLVKPCVLAGSKAGDIVLDPFAGSGTTMMVAKDLGRRAIGLDLKPEYLALARNRTRQGAFML